MAVQGVEDTQTVEHQAALLRVALSSRAMRRRTSCSGRRGGDCAASGRVRLGDALHRRRAGRHRRRLARRGQRGLPVNAEVDFEPRTTAMGQARATARAGAGRGLRQPPRLPPGAHALDRSHGGVAAPVLRRGEVWGALVARRSRRGDVAAGLRAPAAGARGAGRAGARQRRPRAELAASRTRLVPGR